MEPATHPARLRVGIVGAGRVGAVLGAALARAGHLVSGVYAVSDESVARAQALLPGVPRATVTEVVADAELVVLAVPDDALADLVSGLAATGTWQAGQLVVHTSGRFGVSVLRPAFEHHILPMALHPAMTFTGTAMDLTRLIDCVFGVTAPEALRPAAEALVVEMGGNPMWVAEEDRVAYHAGLTHGANFVVTLVAQAMEVLAAAGVADPAKTLGPLVHASVENALARGDAALTGPVARGDAGTVAAHMRELRRLTPDILETYVDLSRATALRALDHERLRPAAAADLLSTLGPQERPQ